MRPIGYPSNPSVFYGVPGTTVFGHGSPYLAQLFSRAMRFPSFTASCKLSQDIVTLTYDPAEIELPSACLILS